MVLAGIPCTATSSVTALYHAAALQLMLNIVTISWAPAISTGQTGSVGPAASNSSALLLEVMTFDVVLMLSMTTFSALVAAQLFV